METSTNPSRVVRNNYGAKEVAVEATKKRLNEPKNRVNRRFTILTKLVFDNIHTRWMFFIAIIIFFVV